MNPSRFDELTKRLATGGISRRGLLRGLGGSLASAGLLAVLGRPAQAAKGGNSACAHFCAQVFGADTPAADDCTSQAAHGTGPCYQCGPKGSGDQKLCGTTCIPKSNCCTNDDCTGGTCQRGTCIANDPCAGVSCPECQACAGGSCGAANNGGSCSNGGTCQGGTCVPPNPCANVTCAECTTCAKGSCVPVQDGTTCSTGMCQSGTCVSITCDCSNLNFCSGHGTCTPSCTCTCTPPYTGVACDQLPSVDCTSFTDCATCQQHASDGCVFCANTVNGAAGVCTTAAMCLSPQVAC